MSDTRENTVRKSAVEREQEDHSVNLLIVEDDPSTRKVLVEIAEMGGYGAVAASSAEEALELLQQQQFAVALVDLVLGGMDGTAFIRRASSLVPDTYIVALSGRATAETAAAAIRSGAFDFLPKPFQAVDLLRTISESLRDRARSLRGVSVLPSPVEGDALLGESPAMTEVFRSLGRIATSSGNVVLSGESGTGRTLTGRAIHRFSPGRKGAFLLVECEEDPRAVELELFGDSTSGQPGKLDRAAAGTLLLRHPERLEKRFQERLLSRIVQAEEENDEDFPRLLAALPSGQQPPSLLPDLFFRLANFRIALPALRERAGDIPLLADYFRRYFNYRHGRGVPYFPEDIINALSAYDWPGNVMELRNAVEQLIINSGGMCPLITGLPPEIQRVAEERKVPGQAAVSVKSMLSEAISSGAGKPMQVVLNRVKRLLAEQALESTGGDYSRAASMLGTTRQALRRTLNSNGR